MAKWALSLLSVCLCALAANNNTAHDIPRLFNSLEEHSRLVDISYCVSTTGIQKPFQCLSRCVEFPNLELITVCSTPSQKFPELTAPVGLEHRAPPL